MDGKTIVAVVVVLLVIVAGIYFVAQLNGMNAPAPGSGSNQTTSVISSTTTAPPAENMSNVTGSNTPASPYYTMTLGRMVNVLGTGWFVAENNTSHNSTRLTLNGENFTANSFAQSNFSTTDGRYLVAQWVQFSSAAAASSYVSAALKTYPNVTPSSGTQGGASYDYGSGFTLNNGQGPGSSTPMTAGMR